MRLLHLVPFFAPVVGGLERVAYELCTQMAGRGHEVTVFTSNLARGGRVQERVTEVEGVTVYRSRALVHLGQHASFWPGFVRMMRRSKFDVVHAHAYRHPHCDLASIAAFRRGAKFVLDPHWPDYPRTAFQSLLVKSYDLTLGHRLMSTADAVLAKTPLEVPWLVARGAKCVQILPNGVHDDWLLRPSDGLSFRDQHELTGLVVLAVGRIDVSKGFHYVVEALSHVPEFTLVVAGPPGPYSPRLAELVKARGLEKRVRMLGFISEEDKIRAIDSCDVFVQPSLFEAFGVSTLEAMSRGKACIGSNVGGLAWLLDGSGVAVAPGDVDEMANALCRLGHDSRLRQMLGEAARKKAQGMVWSNIVRDYERFLTNLLHV